MKLTIIILTATLLVMGCEKQKEQIEKFVFDNTKISGRTVHTYQFQSDGKIKVERSVTYLYRGTSSADSVVTIREYQ